LAVSLALSAGPAASPAAARAVAAPATPAPHVELVGHITASRTVLGQRRVGEARYVAISDLFYRERNAIFEVLDLADQSVIQVRARRATLERRFGVRRNGAVLPPQAEVVAFHAGLAGLAMEESSDGGDRRYWYVEMEASTGRILRTADLATIAAGNQLAIIGADPSGSEAWFAITEVTGHRRSVVLRRVDLRTLEVHDEQRVQLLARRGTAAEREHAVQVHAAADFSQFAIVEYFEAATGMAAGHVYVVDPASGATFNVPAPPTAYGVAFSPDNRYIYLGSAQLGTISRIDVAGHKLDKQVAAPHNLHHLVIRGNKLFALATSDHYAVYDLPELKSRNDAVHPAGVAAAMAELHGNGVASLDGTFFVAPDVEDRRHPARDRNYVIARLVE
jgi:hypothetical protein